MLSIVIVTYNSEEYIRDCLGSIQQKTKDLKYEVICVDNNSHDRTAQIIKKDFPDVRIIYNNENKNFAYATNQGVKISKGKYIMLLNPDTHLKNNALENLCGFLDSREDAGAVAPILINTDGSIQHSCREFPTFFNLFTELTGLSLITGRVSRWKMPDFDYSMTQEVEQPSASALLVRGELLREIGGLDLRYPLYINDVELCCQINKRGYKIFYITDAEIYHERGMSTKLNKPKSILYWHFGMIRYLKEHYPRNPLTLFYTIILLFGMFSRTLIYRIKNISYHRP